MEDLLRGQELPPGIDPPLPMSVTFIPATVFDNPALLRVNSEYLAWLLSLPTLERERLLGGNWKTRPAAGLFFKREWCAVVVGSGRPRPSLLAQAGRSGIGAPHTIHCRRIPRAIVPAKPVSSRQ
jgi:hypothetical protein